MPQAIAYVAQVIFTYTGASLATAYAVAEFAVYAATTYALNKASEALAKKGRDGSAGAGMEVAAVDSAASGRVIYGRVRVGGIHVIPPSTSGTHGEILHEVLALAIHEVDSFESTFLDTDEITSGNTTSITSSANDGKVTGTSKYKDVAWLRRYAGTTTQNVDFILNAAFPSAFPSTFRGRGVAYIAASFDWGKGKTYTGGVPNISAVVKGKRCYDPRLDVSPGASPLNPSYIAFTSCPALCWADYKMTATYGQKVAAADIDWACVVAAADVCDALVAVPGATTAPRYTFNAVLSTETETPENEKLFIDAMLGKYAYTDGKHRVFAGAWRAPVYEIDKEDWVSIGAIQTTTGRGADRFNGVVTYHVDPERNWQRVEGPRRYNDTYKSADAGERIWVEQEQPHCTSKYESERKSEFTLRQSRNGVKLTGVLPPRFMRLRTWDNVTLYFDDLGWVAKTFTVSSCSIDPTGAVRVTLSEEQDADWTDLAGADYGVQSTLPAPSTNPTTPSPLPTFSVTALLGTLQFELSEPLVRPLGTRYQILRSPATLAVAGSYAVVWEGDVTQIVLPADVRTLYWYHGRAVTNSYFSDPTPSSFGIGTAPYIGPESVPGNRSYPDGELLFASTSYWTFVDSAPSVGNPPSSLSFFTSSGFTSQRGFIRIAISSKTDGSIAQLAPSRFDVNSRVSRNAVPLMQGQRGIAYLLARSPGSSGFPFAFNVYAQRVGSPGLGLGAGATLLAGVSVDQRTISSGTWVTYIVTFTNVGSFYDAAAAIVEMPGAYGGAITTADVGGVQLSVL